MIKIAILPARRGCPAPRLHTTNCHRIKVERRARICSSACCAIRPTAEPAPPAEGPGRYSSGRPGRSVNAIRRLLPTPLVARQCRGTSGDCANFDAARSAARLRLSAVSRCMQAQLRSYIQSAQESSAEASLPDARLSVAQRDDDDVAARESRPLADETMSGGFGVTGFHPVTIGRRLRTLFVFSQFTRAPIGITKNQLRQTDDRTDCRIGVGRACDERKITCG